MSDFSNMSPELKRMYIGFSNHMAAVEAQHKEERECARRLEEEKAVAWRMCRKAGIPRKHESDFWCGWTGRDTRGDSTRFLCETDAERAAWDAGRKAAVESGWRK